MTESWQSPRRPSVPVSSVEDALDMLDTPRPLMPSEIRMVLRGLWNTAYAKGREDCDVVHKDINSLRAQYEYEYEYEDPTAAIRRKLEER